MSAKQIFRSIAKFIADLEMLRHLTCIFLINIIADISFASTLKVISVNSAGEPADGPSSMPKVSGDGRYVIFSSAASNLVEDDTNSATDIFLHDLVTGQTERVSIDSYGQEGNADAGLPDISEDGRYISFFSNATNFQPASELANYTKIFVLDRFSGITKNVPLPTISINENFHGFETHGYMLAGNGASSYVILKGYPMELSCPGGRPVLYFKYEFETNKSDAIMNGSAADEAILGVSKDGKYFLKGTAGFCIHIYDVGQLNKPFIYGNFLFSTEQRNAINSFCSLEYYQMASSVSTLVPNDIRQIFKIKKNQNLQNKQLQYLQDQLIYMSICPTPTSNFYNNFYKIKDICLYDVSNKSCIWSYPLADSIILSSDGKTLAWTTTPQGSLLFHNIETGQHTQIDSDLIGNKECSIKNLQISGLGSEGRFVLLSGRFEQRRISSARNSNVSLFIYDTVLKKSWLSGNNININQDQPKPQFAIDYSDISQDGRTIVFASNSDINVTGNTNQYSKVFVRNYDSLPPVDEPLSPQEQCGAIPSLETVDLAVKSHVLEKSQKRIKYSISINNKGLTAAPDTVIVDTLPISFETPLVEIVKLSKGCNYDQDTNTVTCNFGTLKGRQSKKAVITVKTHKIQGLDLGYYQHMVAADSSLPDRHPSDNAVYRIIKMVSLQEKLP
jgi:Tol biopolymer transport system component